MKFEKTDVWGFEHAVRGMRGKGYRKIKDGYEAFSTQNGKSISLGTYKNENDAIEAVYKFKVSRFITNIRKAGYDENLCVVVHNNYVAFPSGEIFNLIGKEMKGHIDRCGYREVILNGKSERVHRVIAEAFIANNHNLPCVNHKDGNKLNNCIDNLEWITYSDNTIHAYQNGLEKKCFGEKHHAHKLTADDVSYIKKVYKKRDEKYGAVALSTQYGVDRTTILDIIRGKTWRNVNATTI